MISTETGNKESLTARSDLIKWVAVAAIFVAGIVASYFIADRGAWYQAALWLIVLAAAASIAFFTTSGMQLLQYFKESRIEIRKVVWPTRQETMQAVLMVLVAVVVMAILLWLVDMALFKIINFLTTGLL